VPFEGPSAFAIMNDRLRNDPVPPRELNPAISSQLQEIVYRAMEREPKNRYGRAQEFARDLEHMEDVGVAERSELQNWKQRRSPMTRRVLFCAMLAMLPILIFALMFSLSRHGS
jgi:hypothetical protein